MVTPSGHVAIDAAICKPYPYPDRGPTKAMPRHVSSEPKNEKSGTRGSKLADFQDLELNAQKRLITKVTSTERATPKVVATK